MPRMTRQLAVQRLREVYTACATDNQAGLSGLVFGISFSDELAGFTAKDLASIAAEAIGRPGYNIDIAKGRRLAAYSPLRQRSQEFTVAP